MNPLLMVTDFPIEDMGRVSGLIIKAGLKTFHELATYIHKLPYGRNANKQQPETVLTDGCGTCSSKHALLQLIMDEHQRSETKLMLGIFLMNGRNTPKVKKVLDGYGLEHIPEAHNYLRTATGIADFTGHGLDPLNYERDIVSEISIQPAQITDFKISYHKRFIDEWMRANPQGRYSAGDLWSIREECIQALSVSSR